MDLKTWLWVKPRADRLPLTITHTILDESFEVFFDFEDDFSGFDGVHFLEGVLHPVDEVGNAAAELILHFEEEQILDGDVFFVFIVHFGMHCSFHRN